MKSCSGRFAWVGLFLAASLSPAWAAGSEPAVDSGVETGSQPVSGGESCCVSGPRTGELPVRALESTACEPRLVADEFQEALTRISSLAAAKPPEALDFSPQAARFVRVAIHETSGNSQPNRASTNWKSTAPRARRTSPWPNAAP